MNSLKDKFGSLSDLKDELSIAGHKKNVAVYTEKLCQAEGILSFEMSQQGVRGYCRDRIRQAQYNVDGAKINLRKAKERYEFALETLVEDSTKLIRHAQANAAVVSPKLVMIREQPNGNTLITIGGEYNYHFTRKKCIAIVEELNDGNPHKMENPKRHFQHDEITTLREKKEQGKGMTTESIVVFGDHHKFADKHLTSDGKGNWRIVLHK